MKNYTMKRFFYILSFVLILCCAFPVTMSGQAQIKTKKVRISDLTSKTTKVVLGTNPFIDAVLKEEVARSWRLSPYEFCTVSEYESLKGDSSYYFLIAGEDVPQNGKASGIVMLTLFKGGKEKDQDPMKERFEVASFPLMSSSLPTGREFAFLPAILNIIQDYAGKAMLSDKDGYVGFSSYNSNLRKGKEKTIVFSECDLALSVNDDVKATRFDEDMTIEEDADAYMGSGGMILSYVVAPSEPHKGDVCYTMLIGAKDQELYFFRKHKITERNWAGFTGKDIKAIAAYRNRKK